ncbi:MULTISPECIES: alpha/beta fold hydrolase [unclassified Streptomyces]|uniref:alpha/beta fold hydrolase n=1 Tax=unclassified Streptomyces TaxID=2593676 RepID=UPI002E254863
MPVTTAHHLRRIATNGVQLNVAIAGDGPAVLLLHGFPHTWQLWSGIMGRLAGQYRVIAPDLRGFGASARAVEGYDAGTLAADAEGLLDALGEPSAAVVGIDAGTAPAVLLALRRPGLVRRLVVMEALLGRLPGAEHVVAGGAPWWFGFHAVPGLAETVLAGNEARTSTGSSTRGRSGEEYPRTSARPSSRRTPGVRHCAARSPITGPCPPVRSRSRTQSRRLG